jgi:protein ImuB
MNFRYKDKLHEVQKADACERIEPEWWIDGGLHRDYYVVEDDEGKRYWLFRLGHYDDSNKPSWFLHGFFA